MDRSITIPKHDGFLPGRAPSARLQLPPSLKSLIAPVLIGFAYYVGAQVAFAVGTLSDRIFAPFWPPNVILFCTLLLVPKRRWWVFLAAAFPAHVIAESGVGMPITQDLVAFATNCSVALLGAIGVRRFLNGPPWFGTLRNAAIYLVITTGLSPAICAFGGAFVQILGGGPIGNYWTYWESWYLGNVLGSATLGPLILVWFSTRPEKTWLKSRHMPEAILLALTLVAACAFAFHVNEGTLGSGFLPALLYSPLPPLLWAAIRFGQRGSTGAIVLMTVVSIWQNLHGSSLFIGPNAPESVLALQCFLLGIAIPIFFLGAAIDELRRSGDATKRIAGALLRAQDEERRRIARELHDSTGQNLVVAGLLASRVQMMAAPSCAPLLAELKDVLDKAMMEIRTVSYLLHPPLLDIRGLDMALRSYVDGFSKRTGISVNLDVSPNLGRMTSDIELALFRVVQEALTNVWRHSGSKTARIHLVRQTSDGSAHVALTIEDDGKGIPDDIRLSVLSNTVDGQETPSGIGLAGMRERLDQVGGRLEIYSTSGKTRIHAIVGLNQESEQPG